MRSIKKFERYGVCLAALTVSFGILCSCTSRTPALSGTSQNSGKNSPHSSVYSGSSADESSLVSRMPVHSSSGIPSSESAPTPTPTPSFDPLAFYDYQFDFDADLSAYEQYMNVQGNEYLLLVNENYPLSGNDIPADLVDVVNTRTDRSPVKMRFVAEKALEALYLEAEKDGILYKNKVVSGGYDHYYVLSVTSAYRSYNSQNYLYESAVKAKMDAGMTRAEAEKAVTTTAKPGASEHQTGLCADMHNFATANSQNGMREEFAASKAGQWLLQNCYKFGFVLRYPADKTEQTGIGYESWHFRYVGRFHATRMQELGMCLEEYCTYLEDYGFVINQQR